MSVATSSLPWLIVLGFTAVWLIKIDYKENGPNAKFGYILADLTIAGLAINAIHSFAQLFHSLQTTEKSDCSMSEKSEK